MRGVRPGRVRGVRSVPRRGEDRAIPSPAVATVHRAVKELSQRDRSLATPSLPSLRRTARKAARAPRRVRHALGGLRRLAARARAWRGGCESVACCPLRRDRSKTARSPRPLLSPRCVSPLAGRPARCGRGAGLSRWRARVWCALSSRRSSVIPCAPRGRTSPFFRRAPAPRPRRHGRHPAPRVAVSCTRRVGSPRRACSREPSRSAFARWALLPSSHHFLSAPRARCEPPSPAARRRHVVATREARGASHRPNVQRLGRSLSAVRSRVRGAWRRCFRCGRPARAARGGGSLVATSLEVGRSIVVSSTARALMGPKIPCLQAKETAHRARRDAESFVVFILVLAFVPPSSFSSASASCPLPPLVPVVVSIAILIQMSSCRWRCSRRRRFRRRRPLRCSRRRHFVGFVVLTSLPPSPFSSGSSSSSLVPSSLSARSIVAALGTCERGAAAFEVNVTRLVRLRYRGAAGVT